MAPETTIETIDLTPTIEGYALIANRFAQSIMSDVRKARQDDSRALLVQTIKIAAHLTRSGRDDLLARLLVAVEQDEPVNLPDDK